MRLLLLSVSLTSMVAACGGSGPAAVTSKTQASVTRPVSTINPKPDDDPSRGNIIIAADVLKACDLPDNVANFAFDSSHVHGQYNRVLDALSFCFMSGPLEGRQMNLIGHADPRGSSDYNQALGGRRADNVKQLIVAEHMSESRISTTSRGALDATGTEEVSWAKDRSVDVILGI